MTNHGVLLYFLFGTLLFFFWVYGIVSFVVDLRRQIIPWVRAQWRKRRGEDTEDPETERLAELYDGTEDE